MDRKASDRGDKSVKNIVSGAELIAPSCYVAAKMKDQPRAFNSRVELFDWFTLDEGTTLPAFSSPWWCRDFVRTYWAGDNHTMPRTLNRSVFALADVVDYLKDVKRVVFDPEATATKVWSNPQSTMTASYFCRFANEMRPDMEKLFEGAAAHVDGDWFCNPDVLLRIKMLCEPSVLKVMRDAQSRAARWEVRDF
jgi:hypothetical protein